QESGYVNITKTGTNATNNYAFLIPQALTLSPNTAYSFAIKARVKPINKGTYPDVQNAFESNQLSARFNNKNLAIHLKYGDVNEGYISLSAGLSHADNDKYKINTSEWHVYRFVFYPDNSIYDVYIDDIESPVFENIPTASMTGSNIIRLGAESMHRCNLDIEYVRMGTGAFYAKPKIVSVVLNAESQAEDKARTIAVTVNTILIDNNEKLLVSLVDSEDNTKVDAVETVVSQSKAIVNITIPAGLPGGKYFVKVAALNGKIGEVDISPKKVEYFITTSAYEGKNLATFGNSITAATNSWAYLTAKRLRFANLYNGAISAAIWYKRERVVAGQTIRTQNYYDADFAGISSVAPTGEDVVQHQKRINNCAVVHIQKFFTELNNKTIPTPDVVIFSYGTNDELYDYTMGNAEDALREKDLSKVNVFTMAAALRWCIDTLRMEIPEVKIYVALPLQSSREGKNEGNLTKMEIIKKICDARSVPYFDCYHDSGITPENYTTYLGDGLHPNEAGKIVHGEYITKMLEETVEATGLPMVSKPEDGKELVSVSSNVLNTSQQFSLTIAGSNASTDISLYSVSGNVLDRQLASGIKINLKAPAVAGVYVLRAILSDKTAKEFKIIVK
ncbi:MAG: SGNH/GDSL hydrolase family protein, partial [Paludibacter sp.]|nr:SGNH/GDSL hydrolase family protein [Paludibacter sp.]